MKLFAIDFETYYSDEYTLSNLTTEAYVRSERFQTIGVGIVNPATKERRWLEHDEFKRRAAKVDWSQVAILAHHAHFDAFILWHHYGIIPGFIFDTLSMANAIHGPGVAKNLAELAVRYNVGIKGHEVGDAKGKRREDFTDAEWAQYGVYCLNDCDLTYGVFKAMLAKFSRTELDLIDVTVRMFSEPVFELDVPRMQEYAAYERQHKAELMERVLNPEFVAHLSTKKSELKDLEKLKKTIIGGPRFASVLRAFGIEPETKVTYRKNKETGEKEPHDTWAFAKTDSFMQGLLEHEDDEVRWLAEARVSVKSTGALTRTERYIDCASRGLMPVYLKYAAAHTHRWGGGDSTNWQNHQRVNRKKPNTGMIRRSVKAPKGKKIVVADSSQIEARVCGFLAGEEWLIEAFAQDRDVYSEAATSYYGRPIDRRANPEHKQEGNVGKTTTLGFQFGLGWYGAAMTFLAGPMGSDPVQFGLKEYEMMGIDASRFLNNPGKVERVHKMPSRLPIKERLLHCIVTEEFVKRYRAKNKRISGFLWKHMEQILAWMNEGVECDAGLPMPLKVSRHTIQLVGFNAMHYPGLEFDGKDYSYLGGKSGRERTRIHGPAATENVVQYIARCIVGEQVVPYSKRFKVALLAHDEAVSVTHEAEAPEALAWKLQLMKTSPTWAPGLPLNAEGGFGDVYGDIEK